MSTESTESVAFDRAAEYYDETRGFPPGVEQRAAELISRVGSLTQTSHVLEIGVGTGRIALPLAPHVHRVFGIDLARPMLRRLRAKRTSEPLDVVEGDITRLPFPSHTFDAAVAVHIFHLVPGWRDAIRELARVLRPGARLILAAGGNYHGAFAKLWDIWETVVGKESTSQTDIGISRDKLWTFPLDEGWQLAGEKQTFEYEYALAPAAFLDALQRRVWSRCWRLTEDEFVPAVAAVRAAIDKQFDDPSQPVAVQTNFHAQAFQPPQ
jgi:SAM-dependent methyltransferase